MIFLLLALQFAFTSSISEAGEVVFAHVENPCMDTESVDFGPHVPHAWQVRLTATSKDEESYFLILASAQVLKASAKDPAFQALAEYEMGNALYRVGLPHLAFEHFSALFSYATPHARSLKLAALKCLVHIQSQAPSLVLLPQSVKALAANPISNLNDGDRTVLDSAIVTYVEKQISASSAPDLGGVSTLLRGSGPYESYALMLQSAKDGQGTVTIQQAEKFLSYDQPTDGLPEFLKGRADATRLLLGQLYYDGGKYSDASAHSAPSRIIRTTSVRRSPTSLGPICCKNAIANRWVPRAIF